MGVSGDAWVQAGATVLIGLLQSGLILYGLRQMRAASTSRDKQLDNQHVETMRALEVLIERTGGATS